jgi:hypothetical protein
MRTDDIDRVLEEITKSQFILSSSLHGLIIAHAYQVPAIWIRHSDLGEGNNVCFKFHDYFSSVDIPLYDGFFDFDEILRDKECVEAFFTENKKIAQSNCDLSQIQKRLLQSCPFVLKKKYAKLIQTL